MKRLILIALLTLPGIRATAEEPAAATLDLEHCYRLALGQSESLAMIREQILQFESKARQSRAAILPDVNFIYTHSFQDTSGVDSGSGGVGGTLTRSERPEAKISARQPIFAGFKEFYAWNGFKALKRKEELELMRAKKRLYQETAQTFYAVIQLEADRANNRVILDLTIDRVKELEARSRLGKSRPSEVLSVKSQVAALSAQDEKIKGDLWVARDLLSFLTGKNMQNAALTDASDANEDLASEEAWILRSSSVTELAILKEDIVSKKYQVKYAWGSFSPSVDLSGNYYLKRVGFQEGIDWDALLTVDFPIFRGGENFAKAREAESQLRWSEWTFRRLKREVESEIRRNFYTLQSSIAQVKALETAYANAKESYELQVKEYRYGLVNNLDVIQALNAMQENKRNLDRTSVQNKLNAIQLKISAEELPNKS